MAKKLKKFISHAHDDKILKYPKAVQDLIRKGKEQKFVTQQELMKAIPNIESNVLLLDELYTLFMDLGIEVMDVQDALIWKKEEEEAKKTTGTTESIGVGKAGKKVTAKETAAAAKAK